MVDLSSENPRREHGLTPHDHLLYPLVAIRRSVVIAAVLLTAAKCTPRLEPVVVDYRRITIERMKEAVVELHIDNPNSFALDLEQLDYRILLTGDTFATGARAEPVGIKARDSIRADFPFTIEMDLAEVLSHIPELADDTVYLELSGHYSFPGMLGRIKAPFRYREAIPLRDELEAIIRPFENLFGE